MSEGRSRDRTQVFRGTARFLHYRSVRFRPYWSNFLKRPATRPTAPWEGTFCTRRPFGAAVVSCQTLFIELNYESSSIIPPSLTGAVPGPDAISNGRKFRGGRHHVEVPGVYRRHRRAGRWGRSVRRVARGGRIKFGGRERAGICFEVKHQMNFHQRKILSTQEMSHA